MNRYTYSIIRITPDPIRAETINVGILVYLEHGLDIRLLQNNQKLKAITESITLDKLEQFSDDLEWLSSLSADNSNLSKLLSGSMHISEPGSFVLVNSVEYESKIDELMKTYVAPSFGKKKGHQTKRIITELKEKFSKAGILGKNLSDIHNHRVVTNFPISESEGIYAELLLKNGAFHLTETLDLRIDNAKQKMGDSALKAITISKAQDEFKGNVKSFVVYAAKNSIEERAGVQQLKLVEGYADNVFNLLSNEDMAVYFEHMFTAAGCSMQYHN
jgi:hypothetical protein